MDLEEKIICSGKTAYSILIGIWYLLAGTCMTYILISSKIALGIILIFSFMYIFLGLYNILYWSNKQIIVSNSKIIYRSILGVEKIYSWSNVKAASYKQGGWSSKGRIIILTDKKISIERNMKNFDLLEKMLKQMEKLHN